MILNNQSELTGRNVTVMWKRPSDKDCHVIMYSIHYRAVEPIIENWVDINITDANVTSYELHLQYSKKYTVVVFAWNNLGRSVKSNVWHVRTAQGKTLKVSACKLHSLYRRDLEKLLQVQRTLSVLVSFCVLQAI